MTKSFYVYAHYDQDGLLRYIGKGSGQRAYSRNRSKAWLEVFSNSEPSVKLLAEFDSEQDALNYEIQAIAEAREASGGLLNFHKGGDGLMTSEVTPELRRRFSEQRQGSGSWWFGKKRDPSTTAKLMAGRNRYLKQHGHPRLGAKLSPEHLSKFVTAAHSPESLKKKGDKMRGRKLTEEHKAKIGRPGRIVPKEVGQAISAAKKGRPNGLLGRVMPDEHRAKIAAARLASDAVKASSEQIWATRRANGTDRGYTTKKARPVRCLETGLVYRCAKDAAIELGLSDKHIQACCVGRRKVTGKRHFEYVGAT